MEGTECLLYKHRVLNKPQLLTRLTLSPQAVFNKRMIGVPISVSNRVEALSTLPLKSGPLPFLFFFLNLNPLYFSYLYFLDDWSLFFIFYYIPHRLQRIFCRADFKQTRSNLRRSIHEPKRIMYGRFSFAWK